MGMTAARLRERRAIARKNAPPPTRQTTDSELLEASRADNHRLRASVKEQAERIRELESLLEQTTAPQTKTQTPKPQDSNKRRGK